MMGVSTCGCLQRLRGCLKLLAASGPRFTDFVTQFPSPFFAAASFDRALMYERGLHIGKEFRGKGINVALSPVCHYHCCVAPLIHWQITGGPMGRSCVDCPVKT